MTKWERRVFWGFHDSDVSSPGLLDCASRWRWRHHGSLKPWCPTTALHGITTQRTLTWKILWAV